MGNEARSIREKTKSEEKQPLGQLPALDTALTAEDSQAVTARESNDTQVQKGSSPISARVVKPKKVADKKYVVRTQNGEKKLSETKIIKLLRESKTTGVKVLYGEVDGETFALSLNEMGKLKVVRHIDSSMQALQDSEARRSEAFEGLLHESGLELNRDESDAIAAHARYLDPVISELKRFGVTELQCEEEIKFFLDYANISLLLSFFQENQTKLTRTQCFLLIYMIPFVKKLDVPGIQRSFFANVCVLSNTDAELLLVNFMSFTNDEADKMTDLMKQIYRSLNTLMPSEEVLVQTISLLMHPKLDMIIGIVEHLTTTRPSSLTSTNLITLLAQNIIVIEALFSHFTKPQELPQLQKIELTDEFIKSAVGSFHKNKSSSMRGVASGSLSRNGLGLERMSSVRSVSSVDGGGESSPLLSAGKASRPRLATVFDQPEASKVGLKGASAAVLSAGLFPSLVKSQVIRRTPSNISWHSDTSTADKKNETGVREKQPTIAVSGPRNGTPTHF